MEFVALPNEIKSQICSFIDPRSISAILPIQAVSKDFRELLWRSRTHFRLGEWENKIKPADLLKRGDTNVIKYLDISGLDQDLEELPGVFDIIPKYSALEYLRLDKLPATTDLDLLGKLIFRHRSLVEIHTNAPSAVDVEIYRNITDRVRLVVSQKDGSNTLEVPTFNFYDPHIAIFRQCNGIAFPTNKIVKAITILGRLVVGCNDGTILVCEFNSDRDSYCIKQTIHEHKNEITCFYSPSSVTTDMVVGSMDGQVTRWRAGRGKEDSVSLIDMKRLPEPIYHLYYSDTNFDLPFLFAASKHKVWFFVNGEMKKQGCKFDGVITGLFYNARTQDLYISTQVEIHRVSGNALRYSEKFQIQTAPHGFSNLKIMDQQFIVELSPTEIEIKPFLSQQVLASIEGKFDSSDPNLFDFFPGEPFITVSNGPCLLTYDIVSARQIACISPRISKANLLTKKFPACTALWYSPEGFLFASFSDNKVYWWNPLIIHDMDLMPVSMSESSQSSEEEQLQELLSDEDFI